MSLVDVLLVLVLILVLAVASAVMWVHHTGRPLHLSIGPGFEVLLRKQDDTHLEVQVGASRTTAIMLAFGVLGVLWLLAHPWSQP